MAFVCAAQATLKKTNAAGSTSPSRRPKRCLSPATLRAITASVGGALFTLSAAATAAIAASDNTASKYVLDYGNSLTSGEERRLDGELHDLEKELGYRVRVLCQPKTGALINGKDLWPLDERSVVVVVNPVGGNILNFNVGNAAKEKLQRNFLIELQARYGNKFYVKDFGEDRAILDSIDDIRICLRRPSGCRQVPGLGRDQFTLAASMTALSGAVAGISPRQGGKKEFDPAWLLIFSPLWLFLLVTFGIGPVVQREGWLSLDLLQNAGIFTLSSIGCFFGSRRVFPPRA